MNHRTIKFRVWDTKDKKWRTNQSLFNYTCECESLNTLFGNKNENDYCPKRYDEGEFIFQQFTGLVDLVGKEIYEGDIIRHTIGPNKYADYTVVFEDGAFFIKNETWGRIYLYCVQTRIVIGTIFDEQV